MPTKFEAEMKNKLMLLFFLIAVLSVIRLPAQIKSIKLVVSLTGSIIDHQTRNYVTVRYEVFDKTGKRVARGRSNAAQKGYYFVTGLKPGKSYFIKFFDMAYLRTEYKLDIPYTDKYAEYSKDFLVVPRKKHLKLFLSVPPFELGKTKLRYGIEEYLEFYTKLIAKNPRVKFEIQCYPDKAGDVKTNRLLTDGRVNSLKVFFVSHGARDDRIYTKPLATTDPDNPPPVKKRSKGKRYIGPTYIVQF
jgi:hypothetical protein